MIKLVITVLFFSAVLTVQNFPVPNKQIGIYVGSRNAEIQLEFIYDPICDNTAEFDQKLQQVLNSLTNQEVEKISLRFIVFPLPYHMSAHKLAQGIIYVLEKKGSKEALQLLREVLATKEQWYQKKVREQSIEQLTKRIAQKINKSFGLNFQKTMKALTHGSKTDKKARQWSKLTMGVLKAAGTPRLFVNRAPIEDVMFMTTEQLKMLIKSMLNTTDNIDQN